MKDQCISRVTRCGGKLVVRVPDEFVSKFPHTTEVELIRVKTIVKRME